MNKVAFYHLVIALKLTVLSHHSLSFPEGEGAAPSEPALPLLHPLRPRGKLSGGEGGPKGGVRCNSFHFNASQLDSIQSKLIQFNSIQVKSIQFNMMQFNSIQVNSMQLMSTQFNSIQFNSVEFG